MTKFLDFYSIFPIPDPKEFLGISPDRDEGRTLTTLGKSFVLILDVSNNKQRHSWTISDKLSTKVVYDAITEKYVGTFGGGRTLRCWDDTTEDINKCKKLKFQRTIEDLITNDEGNAFVVYNDGFMEPITIALQNRKEKIANDTEKSDLNQTFKIMKSRISKLNDGSHLYTYFKKCKRSDQLSLVSYRMSNEGILNVETMKEHIISQTDMNIKAVAYAVIEGEHSVLLLTIWSDKRIFMLDILDNNSVKQTPGNFVSVIGEIDVSVPVCLAGVSKNFVVIYGSTANKDGALLLLYNTQYKVIKAKQYFKVYFDVARVWPLKEHILLALGQNLSAVKYRISKALLAELIGTQMTKTYDTLIEEEQSNEIEDFEENLTFNKDRVGDSLVKPIRNLTLNAKDSILAQEPLTDEFDKSIADGHYIPFQSYNDFEMKLNTLRQVLLHVDVVESNREHPEIDTVGNLFDADFSHPMILNLVQHMEKCGASEQEISEKLIHVFIKADRKSDVYACLSRYGNHSEKTLAKALKFVLSNFSDVIENVLTQNDIILPKESEHIENKTPMPKAEETPAKQTISSNEKKVNSSTASKRRRTLSRSSHKSERDDHHQQDHPTHNKNRSPNKLSFEFLDYVLDQDMNNIHTAEKKTLEQLPFELKLLNKILSHNFNAEQMSVRLRLDISYQDMIKLLRYLYILLKCKDVFQFELYPKYAPSSVDFELQIFRWFGSLINAHFQQMILSKDIELMQLLSRWHKMFLLYKQEIQQLQETAALLYKIVQKSKSPVDNNYVKWYSIEAVNIF